MRKSLVAVAAALALSPLAARAQAYPYAPHSGPHRSPWYIGFGIGTGTGATYSDGMTSSFHDLLLYAPGTSDYGRIGLNFKVGATITPQFLLGFDFTGIRAFGNYNDGFADYATWVQITNWDIMGTLFPMERGLFFRAGTGLSVLSTGLTGFGVSNGYQFTGWNGTLGAGYAFWLGRRFNLTVGADFSRQWYGSSPGAPDASGFFLVYMGFDWY